ncbi:MAG: ribokinase [Clostridia bacterium]|nr:ribokinase [Clostridia bacterium]
MVKISVIGICGNSVFMYADHFHENGETLVADSVFEEIGGKGINQAVAAKRMGAEVSFLCAIGDDQNGEKSITEAKENGINPHFKIKKGKSTPFAFILTDKNGENRVTEYKSAELEVEDVISFEEEIAKSDILLLQQEVPSTVNEKAVEIADKYGVKVILNPAPIREIPDVMAERVYMVTPNEQEMQAIDIKRFKNCITTLGKKGCLINGKETVAGIEVKAVDTTGAGDTFNGTLAVCISEGMSLNDAAKYAVTASGISVGRKYVLNAIPYREEIERMLKNE